MSFERFTSAPTTWSEPDESDVGPIARSCKNLGASDAMPDPRLGLAREAIGWLEEARRPSGITEHRWFALRRDLRNFERQWLDIALGCGWGLLDLFGTPSDLSHRRLDKVGAALLLNGRDLLSIDGNRIVIENGPAGPSIFYRQSPGCSVPFDRSHAVPIWEAVADALDLERKQ